jgi:hypothetical protein
MLFLPGTSFVLPSGVSTERNQPASVALPAQIKSPAEAGLSVMGSSHLTVWPAVKAKFS